MSVRPSRRVYKRKTQDQSYVRKTKLVCSSIAFMSHATCVTSRLVLIIGVGWDTYITLAVTVEIIVTRARLKKR